MAIKIVDYQDQESLHTLAVYLLARTPPAKVVDLMTDVLNYRLMRPQSWFMRNVLMRIFGEEKVNRAVLLTKIKTDELIPMWVATLTHMVFGKDQYDETSAGGWSGAEIVTFMAILSKHGWTPDPDHVEWAENHTFGPNNPAPSPAA
jgi:hypothetical protein